MPWINRGWRGELDNAANGLLGVNEAPAYGFFDEEASLRRFEAAQRDGVAEAEEYVPVILAEATYGAGAGEDAGHFALVLEQAAKIFRNLVAGDAGVNTILDAVEFFQQEEQTLGRQSGTSEMKESFERGPRLVRRDEFRSFGVEERAEAEVCDGGTGPEAEGVRSAAVLCGQR